MGGVDVVPSVGFKVKTGDILVRVKSVGARRCGVII